MNEIKRRELADNMAKVFKVLGNVKATEIMLLLDTPLPTKEINKKIGLSISRTCRLVDMLQRINLVTTEYKVNMGTKRVSRIVSRNLKMLKVYFER